MNGATIFGRLVLGALMVSMFFVSLFSHAQQDYGRFTVVEVAGLPQYCQDKMRDGNRGVNKDKWIGTFGRDNWLHLHHYCYGLIYFSRASMEIDAKSRRRTVLDGIANFDYVLQRWPANFSLYQTAAMYKTQLEMMKKWN